MEKNILIVEDDEKIRKMLSKIICEIDENLVVYETDNIDTAYRYALQRRIHLFLLDIIIDTTTRGDTSGIDFASNIREIGEYRTTPIIFITSLEDPKLFAYSELHCFQYIEKPFAQELIVEKVQEALGITLKDDDNRNIFFRKSGILFPVKLSNIQYIVFEKPVIRIYQVNDILEIGYQPIGRILYKLNSNNFLQCNRNTIVNIYFIENIDVINKFIKLKGTANQLVLGNIYRKKFMRDLGND